jgi:D-aminopeptidase
MMENKPAPCRARDIGVAPGIFRPGRWNAITDVAGVLVGHVTCNEGNHTRTGVTAIRPHERNLYQDRMPAGLSIANGHGKLTGVSQIVELGELETPIVLTNTLAVGRAMEAVIDWTLNHPGNESVITVNAVVGETNDGKLNDIRRRGIEREHVLDAITSAKSGPVDEGCVGAGTGTICFGWKGGIGTSSRLLPQTHGGYTVGVLVQSNYGGALQIDGCHIGKALDQYYLAEPRNTPAGGSIMIVIATDAPLSDRNLTRLAKRSSAGLARTGSAFTNDSGDYAIAFSTHPDVCRTAERRANASTILELPNERISPLFVAVAEATEEAIYNSLMQATDTDSVHRLTGKSVTFRALNAAVVASLVHAKDE